MNCNHDHDHSDYSRRDFLTKTTLGLGGLSLASMMNSENLHASNRISNSTTLNSKLPHFVPKVKRVIYLFQSGAPSQLDLFDYKPMLNKMQGQELPPSVFGEQRLTGMTAGQNSFPLAGSLFNFNQHGNSGAWMSDLMPEVSKISDELCFIKSMHTDALLVPG
jgi:hypothetical protein